MGRSSLRVAGVIAALLGAAVGASTQDGDGAQIIVPRLWDARALAGWATPVAGLGIAPAFVSEEEYYAAPVDDLATYPVYHPSREPAGYREALVRGGPRKLIEPEKLVTEADWIEAGRRVFEQLDTPASRTDDPEVIAHFTDAAAVDRYRDTTHDVMSADGILLDYRWVVDREGRLQIGLSSCSGCHTRLMPDGSTIVGAPSNFDVSGAPAVRRLLAKLRLLPGASRGAELYAHHGVPWRAEDVHAVFRTMDDEAVGAFFARDDGAPPGTTFARFGGSPFFTTRMADLRGIRGRRYLDATGTHKNREPADVARYGILVEYADAATFGPHRMLPEGSGVHVRPPDAAMYALALFLYSLDVPPSPYPFDDEAARGREVFTENGCAKCHTPPAYTNNKLIAVPGFEPPPDALERFGLDVSARRVYTDPGLALHTRKGTGYYKVPSLRGVWYRGLYGHSGQAASLEDWFDPARQRADWVPTGWRGLGVERSAVPGHDFGLDLDEADKRALIAFLRTL